MNRSFTCTEDVGGLLQVLQDFSTISSFYVIAFMRNVNRKIKEINSSASTLGKYLVANLNLI